MNEGEWVLVRHENPQKFESKWFGPYQIAQKMALGTYRLQDPKGKELQALVHGNRLLKAHINAEESLRQLWASPAAKDALRQNRKAEFVNSDTEGTEQLERLLLDENLEPVESIVNETQAKDLIPPANSESSIERRAGPSSFALPPAPKRRKITESELPEPNRREKTPVTPTRQSTRRKQPNSRYR